VPRRGGMPHPKPTHHRITAASAARSMPQRRRTRAQRTQPF
jgi:hypothetical protein